MDKKTIIVKTILILALMCFAGYTMLYKSRSDVESDSQSCQSEKDVEAVSLEETSETVSFAVSSNSSLFIKSLSVFTDSSGTDYLTFLSNEQPEIYVYRLDNRQLVKTIGFQKEGADGVGPRAAGYMMKDWNEIYIPNLFTPEISVIDSSGHKLRSIDLTRWNREYQPVPTRSVVGNPLIFHENKVYCMQLPNPYRGEGKKSGSPVDIQIDLEKGDISPLLMEYPSGILRDSGEPSLGIEDGVSRCFDGKHFVYSFSFDEDIHILSSDGKTIETKQAKSRYIDDLKLPENIPSDFKLSVKMMCEWPFYSNLVYDKYRRLYYRFVFPQTELDNDENFADLWLMLFTTALRYI